MIVPMKKVSLIIRGDEKKQTLKKLRKLGIMHVEITEGTGERLAGLNEQIVLLQSALFTLGKSKNVKQTQVDTSEALSVAQKITRLEQEKKCYQDEINFLSGELDRLKGWGDVDIDELKALAEKGVKISLCEKSADEYALLPESVKTVKLEGNKSSVKFLVVGENDVANSLVLPEMSTDKMRERISALNTLIDETQQQITSCICYAESIKKAVKALEREVQFETYAWYGGGECRSLLYGLYRGRKS